MKSSRLIVIAGPTAVGKTAVAVHLARDLQTDIVNADSRQVFREMSIGTAAPTDNEKSLATHHFAGHRSIHEPYNASMFEQEVIGFLDEWFKDHDTIIVTGGSGLYINAVLYGIDDLPNISHEIRNTVHSDFRKYGLQGIQAMLKETDPEYYERVDLNNPQRIMKALEVYLMTGRTYSSFLTGAARKRNFQVTGIALDLPRGELHEKINSRVDAMIENGLLDEARSLYPFRDLNALNTVGYKELFAHLDGHMSLSDAVTKIKDHTRQYARRQLTWFRRDPVYKWFHPGDYKGIIELLKR
ncbi:MAG TPA: tRNA (adenosine(37)-N6)-dimethylallyltransferase MiaA [Bacteroidales bacterium]|nr:tRNA (adenosine(37)-N6)-dimethylallyltransferase MiaA [Bacteroidales bacterium]